MKKLNLSTSTSLLPSSPKTLPGEATAGKTQLCLRLLLTAQLPEDQGGLGGSALWLCSEKGDPPVRRLAQLSRNGNNNASASSSSASTSVPPPPPSTDSVFVEKGLATPAEPMDAPDRMEPLMTAAREAEGEEPRGGGNGNGAPRKRRRRIRLVVIDSIAALFRDAAAATDDSAGGNGAAKELGNNNSNNNGNGNRSLYAARASALFAVAARLKRLADDHSLAVVVVNQVTDVISDDSGEDLGGVRALLPNSNSSSSSSFAPRARLQQPPTHTAGLRLVSSGREVAPALGLAWASCVGIRLFLSRAAPVGSSFGGGGNEEENLLVPSAAKTKTAAAATRCLQVVFAPHLPPSYCLATVDERGLVGVTEVEEEGSKRQKQQQQQEQQQQKAQAPPESVVVVCSGVFADS